ncbi:MAG: gliding motility-associated C-terminal domain-containing protein [Saprospiraceae bacterium]|nr:gliding motility-associated C-terminal domain-containing protein [Saprospiraceae bacterium]
MKQLSKLVLLCLFIFSLNPTLVAQASTCFDSYLSPFCSGIAQYPANFDGTGSGSGPQAPAGPNYDCLGTQGNPTYFSLTIEQTGSIYFTLDNTANVDIDFILWGPFSSIADAQTSCDSMGQGGQWGNVDTCSYSSIAQEPVSISNAQAGEVYILMVTNYANVATNIFSTPGTGTGSVACPCDIPYAIDTLSAINGNQGFIADTLNGINQFVVCPGNTLGIEIGAKASLNDTVSLYGPFTTVNNAFANNTVFSFNPNAPSFYDSLTIFTLLTPTISDIGSTNFSMGMKNNLYTGGLTDSSCFDQINIQVIVPGVNLSNMTVCSGEDVLITADSILTTTVGSSNYSWSQLSGPTVSFSSTTERIITVSIPSTNSTSSNDSIVIEVDYNYSNLCPMKDTIVLYFEDISLSLNANPDSVCIGQTSNLSVLLSDTLSPGVCDDYDVTTIPFSTVSGSGTTVSLADDELSSVLPIGFNFNFYCNSYSNFYISSNGFITFDPLSGNGCCSGQTLPDPFTPNNLIAMCWTDCNPSSGGTIEYFTTGVAPNRQLIVNFINVPPYSISSGNQTVQAILYEGTEIIELHITNATPSAGLTSLTLGLENYDGSLGHPGPGTNGTSNTISNTAFRFSPKNYGPFYTWLPTGSLSATDIYNPVATPTATTNYSVTVNDGSCTYVDTATIAIVSGLSTPVITCDSTGFNFISFSWSDLGLPTTGFYEYSIDGGNTWIVVGTGLSATVSSLSMNTSYTVLVRANDGTGGACSISGAGSNICTTLNQSCSGIPSINISLSPTDLLCNNDSSGCISAIVSGGSGSPMNLTWSNGTIDIDSICTLPAGSYTLVVTDTISSGGGSPTNTTLYSEAFDGIHNWTLNVPSGANGADNNFWQVDNDESGMPVGSCGNSGGTNLSLHITSVFFPGGGAAYDAGGLCGILFCPLTNMRAESPIFSTIGHTNLTFEFNFIANGTGLIDNASVVYNDGSGWQILDPSIKSSLCGSGQGLWTKFSMTLPSSCENNASVQVGINWENNDDGIGTDPSVAIDSVLVYANATGTSLITCVDSQSVTLTEPPLINIVVDSLQNPICNGSSDGSINISTSGGTGSYIYNWNNGSTSEDISGLNNALYTISVTDQNNCTDTAQINLISPNAITLNLIDSVNIGCNDSSNVGSIDILVGGGTGSLTYLWSNSETTEDITGLTAGNYTITITDSNNCTESMTYTIVQDTGLSLTINPIQDTLDCDLSPIGSLEALGIGGSNINYTWSNSSTNANISGLSAGNYTVIAINNNGCTDTLSQTIYAPIAPTLNAFVSVTGTTSVNVQLNSTIFLSAGSSGFTYYWSSIVDPVTGNSNIANPLSDTTSANPDPEGIYSYIITAFNNDSSCIVTDTLWVTVEAPFQGIPDAFSPNGDNINDTFKPITLADSEVKLFKIYNRWGQEVYNGSNSPGSGWDGKYMGVEQPSDVYIYVLVYQKFTSSEPKTVRGEFTLIR